MSTLGKCIYYHGGTIPENVVKDGFLAKLPITTDTEEAQVTHALFCDKILEKNAFLLAHEAEVKAALDRIQ